MAAKSTRRRRKKKNPTTAQIVVIAVGGTIGVGLVGYGIYLAVKKPTPSLPEGGAGPMNQWGYQVIPSGPVFLPRVWPPGGADPITFPPAPNYAAAMAVAISHIKSEGGVPVPRGAG